MLNLRAESSGIPAIGRPGQGVQSDCCVWLTGQSRKTCDKQAGTGLLSDLVVCCSNVRLDAATVNIQTWEYSHGRRDCGD